MENDFEFGGRKFKLNKVNAIKQFHIVRRIGPMLAEMLPAMKGSAKLKDIDKLSEDEKLDVIAKFATPLMEGMAKLPDAEAEIVLYGLLESVEMQQVAGNWIRLVSGQLLMVQDLDLPGMLQIAGRAFMFNLSGFFGALPRS